jgi:hypothetical protein
MSDEPIKDDEIFQDEVEETTEPVYEDPEPEPEPEVPATDEKMVKLIRHGDIVEKPESEVQCHLDVGWVLYTEE